MFVMWQYGLLNQPPQGYPDRDCHELYSMEIKRVKKETVSACRKRIRISWFCQLR
nr:MAG TPA: Protein of unknown function (DUF2949) [Caudoviricetes sp.]DAI34196.1 MAG TPA: Protein of unknown function (DUF2949) [Caudoviricetes sp.]DAO44083.1 MAG TPA: Protein of unknown function (DUF2949) [Bacteriophage sp.]